MNQVKRQFVARSVVGPLHVTQVERQWRLRLNVRDAYRLHARRVADREEASDAPAFRFVGVDREAVVRSAARMRDVVDTAAQRALHPRVVEIEDDRRMHRNRRSRISTTH